MVSAEAAKPGGGGRRCGMDRSCEGARCRALRARLSASVAWQITKKKGLKWSELGSEDVKRILSPSRMRWKFRVERVQSCGETGQEVRIPCEARPFSVPLAAVTLEQALNKLRELVIKMLKKGKELMSWE